MSDELPTAEITDHEWLARFVLFRKWIRRSDHTIKPDAFIPPSNLELSVTRHNALSKEELWQVGQEVADARPSARLHGRADLRALDARKFLQVRPHPPPEHHAVITGWPKEDKPRQKFIALELAKAAHYLPNPNPAPTQDHMN